MKEAISLKQTVELLRQSVTLCGQVRVRCFGSSMWPVIRAGDTVVIDSLGGNAVAVGDILAYISRDNRLIVHRVLLVSGTSIITRGDAVPNPDPAIAPSAVLGRVARLERSGRSIDLDGDRSGVISKLLSIARKAPFSPHLLSVGVRVTGLMKRLFAPNIYGEEELRESDSAIPQFYHRAGRPARPQVP